MRRPELVSVQKSPGMAVLFLSYYWEKQEEGVRIDWGYDSAQTRLPPGSPIKPLEEGIAAHHGYDKVTILNVFIMGMEEGIPIARGLVG